MSFPLMLFTPCSCCLDYSSCCWQENNGCSFWCPLTLKWQPCLYYWSPFSWAHPVSVTSLQKGVHSDWIHTRKVNPVFVVKILLKFSSMTSSLIYSAFYVVVRTVIELRLHCSAHESCLGWYSFFWDRNWWSESLWRINSLFQLSYRVKKNLAATSDRSGLLSGQVYW